MSADDQKVDHSEKDKKQINVNEYLIMEIGADVGKMEKEAFTSLYQSTRKSLREMALTDEQRKYFSDNNATVSKRKGDYINAGRNHSV